MLCIQYTGQPIPELQADAPWLNQFYLNCPDGVTLNCTAANASTVSARPGDWLILLPDGRTVRHETGDTFSQLYSVS